MDDLTAPSSFTPPRESGASRPRLGESRRPLVLSLFPGVDLLGRAFQRAGFTVVRGPDLILDDPIEAWAGTPGFDGVIGGPPCQNYSDANRRRDTSEGDRLVTHFLRVVAECCPTWFLMENVRNVPDVALDGYVVQRLDITDVECGGPTRRLRHVQFGHRDGWIMRPPRTGGRWPVTAPAVLTSPSSAHDRHCRRCDKQGAPYLPLRALTRAARYRVLGNAVPVPTALALAHGVLAAGPVTAADCVCGCGRPVTPQARHAGPACRKRMERIRRGESRRRVTLHV